MQVNQFLKRLLFCIFTILFLFSAKGQQPYLERLVTLHYDDVTVAKLLKSISEQAGVVFSYTQPFNDMQKRSFHCDRCPLNKVLTDLLTPLNCSYVLKDKYVIIKNEKPSADTPRLITGYIYNVFDSTSISEASVYLKQSKHSTVTNSSGFFALSYTSKVPDVTVTFAKEDYLDTSVVVYNKTKQELQVYLFPKQPILESPTLVASTVVGDGEYHVKTDSLVAPTEKKESNFWSRFKASHPNIRNISDTLFNHLSISLIPSVSTNKDLSINTVNEYSLNILVGQSKGVTKCEVGWLLNIDNGDVQWAQVAWGGNIVAGNVKGGQYANIFNSVSGDILGGQYSGVINVNRGNLKGGQAAGIINVDKGNLVGGTGAGIANIVGGNMRGASGAGIFNVNKKSVVGAQVAGIFNEAHDVYGAQVSGIYNHVDSIRGFQVAGICNLSRYNSGFQLASVYNRASYLKGSQLGLVNLVDSCDGVPIGFFSLVKKGYHKMELTTDEMGFATIGFKTGVRSFYNNFFVGGNYLNSDLWTYGYGLGSLIRTSKNSDLSIAISTQQTQRLGASEINLNLLNKFYIGFDYNLSRRFGFSIGPTLNLMVSDITDDDFNTTFDKLAPYTFLNQTNNQTNVKMWVGGQLSVRLF